MKLRMFPFVFGCLMIGILSTSAAHAADWTEFRGPGGMGESSERGLPLTWSATENIVWKLDLPGPGGSTPITLKNRLFLTSYTGYGLAPAEGDQKNLRRHLLCVDRSNGRVMWKKEFEPKLPEHDYQGEGSYHGYSSSTPATDGERLYVFFGKSGVFCFDLNGKELWRRVRAAVVVFDDVVSQ